MRDRQLLPVSLRMRGNPGKRDQNRYCEYHKEKGHDTNECIILRMEIEKLIQCVHLKEFTRDKRYENPQGRDADCQCLEMRSDDPLVIAPKTAHFTVERMLGVASLYLTMGTGLTSTTFRAQFTVVDIPNSSYNG
ncbi:hypothetical protein LIER_34607 [Lithospermum erythrorhizon]|uniref:Retrotransposon gag domain-containing protein n=1 Tax=Lithospermum erythrorhizon TaxID=34254 RepID=A0AAV3S234_LITER